MGFENKKINSFTKNLFFSLIYDRSGNYYKIGPCSSLKGQSKAV
jgi:hypothetical protein